MLETLTGVARDRSRALAAALWPIGGLSFSYIVLQASGTTRTDFFGVWNAVVEFLAHRPPYARVFPYPPSALVVMMPFGFTSFTVSRAAFLLLSAAAVLVAGALCLRLFGRSWRSPAGAVVLAGLTLFVPATTVLRLANVDAILVAGFCGMLVAGASGRWNVAGLLLGLTLAVKPVLLPILVIPLLWRQWRAFALAVAVPAILSIPPLVVGPQVTDFFSVVTPTLLEGNAPVYQPFNVSLQRAMTEVGFPSALAVLARAGIVALAAALVWWRVRRRDDEALRLVEVSSIVLLATFLAFSFSWPHYGLYLLPLVVSVVHPGSMMRSWIAWAGVYAIGTADAWSTERIPSGLSTLLSYRFTWGWLALLVAAAITWRSRERAGAA